MWGFGAGGRGEERGGGGIEARDAGCRCGVTKARKGVAITRPSRLQRGAGRAQSSAALDHVAPYGFGDGARDHGFVVDELHRDHGVP